MRAFPVDPFERLAIAGCAVTSVIVAVVVRSGPVTWLCVNITLWLWASFRANEAAYLAGYWKGQLVTLHALPDEAPQNMVSWLRAIRMRGDEELLRDRGRRLGKGD